MTTIATSISNFRSSLQIAKAVRRGQKIVTTETAEGRSYEIIINR